MILYTISSSWPLCGLKGTPFRPLLNDLYRTPKGRGPLDLGFFNSHFSIMSSSVGHYRGGWSMFLFKLFLEHNFIFGWALWGTAGDIKVISSLVKPIQAQSIIIIIIYFVLVRGLWALTRASFGPRPALGARPIFKKIFVFI